MASAQKKCGKCEKTVYPTEEIKCLDKYWHKGCLKCTVCGTTLNIKNVKGYDKMPYCNVHYPQPKPTAVVDNPEMQRIKALSDIQSNAKYHEDFNKNKGKFTAVADDPATTRAKEQQRIVSQAEYTGKRKESTSQILAPDNTQQTNEIPTTNTNTTTTTNTTRTSSTSESAVGRLVDYDPLNNNHGSLGRGYEPTSKALHEEFDTSTKNVPQPNITSDDTQDNNNNNNPKRISLPPAEEKVEASSNDLHHDDQVQAQSSSHGDTESTKMKVRALYTYKAAEGDELSFNDGDVLIDCEHIDEGWMLGKNPKTGRQGLLPSNYVEIID